MANQKEHSGLLEVVDTGLGALASIAEQHEILSAVMSEIPKEMWRPEEAEDFCSLVKEVKNSYEDLRSRLTNFRGILEGEGEDSTDGSTESKNENVKEEQFRQKVSEFKERLYVLFTEVMSMTMIPGRKEEVINYEEFKSCLEGSKDHTFQKVIGTISGRIDAHKEQVKKFGCSVQKDEKWCKVDDLLNKVLDNIHLVGFLVTQIGWDDEYDTNPMGNPKECEESLKEIRQMINALKAD